MWNGRVAILAVGGLIAVILAALLYRYGANAPWLPGCFFHRLTGLYCIGCGMTRAASATLHGHIGQAFRYNPLGMVLFPLALLGSGLEAFHWATGKKPPFSLRVRGRWAWALLWVILAFWILRNIPVWPCSLLAPPSAF